MPASSEKPQKMSVLRQILAERDLKKQLSNINEARLADNFLDQNLLKTFTASLEKYIQEGLNLDFKLPSVVQPISKLAIFSLLELQLDDALAKKIIDQYLANGLDINEKSYPPRVEQYSDALIKQPLILHALHFRQRFLSNFSKIYIQPNHATSDSESSPIAAYTGHDVVIKTLVEHGVDLCQPGMIFVAHWTPNIGEPGSSFFEFRNLLEIPEDRRGNYDLALVDGNPHSGVCALAKKQHDAVDEIYINDIDASENKRGSIWGSVKSIWYEQLNKHPRVRSFVQDCALHPVRNGIIIGVLIAVSIALSIVGFGSPIIIAAVGAGLLGVSAAVGQYAAMQTNRTLIGLNSTTAQEFIASESVVQPKPAEAVDETPELNATVPPVAPVVVAASHAESVTEPTTESLGNVQPLHNRKDSPKPASPTIT